MRMSVPAYVSLGIATAIVFGLYAAYPDTRFLLTALPMLLVLFIVPVALTEMNRRQMAKVDPRGYKNHKIKDIQKLPTGTGVRICGSVEKVSLKWLNRPNFLVDDGTGMIRVIMFASPREDIKPGDKIEALGSVHKILSKDKRIWGVSMKKI